MKLKLKAPIHLNPAHKGMLHEDTGTPKGDKIPAKKLAAAANSSDPAERKRAVFAQNASKWNHGGNKQRTTVKPKNGTPVYMAD